MAEITAANLDSLPSLELVLPLDSIALGRAGAGAFVERIVDHLSADLGFGFIGHEAPPRAIEALQAAFARSAATQRPLPVALQGEHPALTGIRADMRLAFWRSVVRFRNSLGFTSRDELAIDLEILDRAAFDEVSKRSRAVLYATLVGSTMCQAVTGRRPEHPRAFTQSVLTYGLSDAILIEREG